MKYTNILLTNDDGYDSSGLKILETYLSKKDVKFNTVAPVEQRSGASSSITIYGQLKTDKIRENCIAVNGTPVDCVKFGLKNICHGNSDLVISGINKGDNCGESVFYSGTVGATIESTLQGVDSVAMSLYTAIDNSVKFNEDALESMVSDFFENEYSGGFVSLNFPNCTYSEFMGFKWVELSSSTFVEKYTEIEDGIFEIGLDYYREEDESETTLLKKNWATITPLKISVTDYSKMK